MVRSWGSQLEVFYLVALARRKTNTILSLTIDGTNLYAPKHIKLALESHFKNIYNVSKIIPVDKFDCNLDEIWSALRSMDGSRAPGPDGFNVCFLKSFLKDNIVQFFSNLFNEK
ncbi:hypothetical protein GQ457_17G005630 [Hibiscus cannabinus]